MLVEPRCATRDHDTYGDWIFVLAINPKNSFPSELIGRHSCQATGSGATRIGGGHHSTHWDITADGVVNYVYRIPRDHPAGLYWIHPHAHGLSLNQVAAGLATLLTIGQPDYLCDAPGCARRGGEVPLRHLVLKDAQIMPDGRLKLQQDSRFCARPDPKSSRPAGKGFCGGLGQQYRGGTWFVTINGQVNPEIDVGGEAGEVWRILNASGSATHWLAVQDAESGADLPLQVLSVDGVSLEIPPGSSVADLQAKLGRKMTVVACPSFDSAARARSKRQPVCAARILMMPSSRVEIGVTPRGIASRRALLRTYAWNTGPAGDDWPGVELASIRFPEHQNGASADYAQVRGQSSSLLAPGGMLSKTIRRTGGASPTPARCEHVPPGRVRQIVFGQPGPGLHGLGYRELKADQPLTAPVEFKLFTFDHAAESSVCVSLAPGDRHARPDAFRAAPAGQGTRWASP